MQDIAWYLTFASVSYQVSFNKKQENYSIPCNWLWTVCLIVRSTLTFGSFAKYSANLITSERASVTWNKLETFLTNITITETLNNKSFSWNILLEVTGSRLQITGIISMGSVACVGSVSVRFRRKERGTRVKDREKSGASKRAGRGWGSFLPSLPPPLLSLFGSRFISRAVKTESPLPRYFFAPKPNGNACFAGYGQCKV